MDAEGYNQCVHVHSDGLYRFVLKLVKDEDVASDIIQDTYEKMWRKVSTIDESKAKTYLFTTAYHGAIDHFRRSKRMERLEDAYDQPVEPAHYGNSDGGDINEILNSALEQLPAVQKSVLMLRDYEGYTYEEIGRITGLTESQVKVYIFRGRQFLKKILVSVEAVTG